VLDSPQILRYNGRDMGVLYVVATPIGNLEDITLRALRVLREVSLIAAEDTRTTAKLLARYDIHTPMLSFFEHNELVRNPPCRGDKGRRPGLRSGHASHL
jgi:precorrin-2 methylase